jgi:hypothetical protein
MFPSVINYKCFASSNLKSVIAVDQTVTKTCLLKPAHHIVEVSNSQRKYYIDHLNLRNINPFDWSCTWTIVVNFKCRSRPSTNTELSRTQHLIEKSSDVLYRLCAIVFDFCVRKNQIYPSNFKCLLCLNLIFKNIDNCYMVFLLTYNKHGLTSRKVNMLCFQNYTL